MASEENRTPHLTDEQNAQDRNPNVSEDKDRTTIGTTVSAGDKQSKTSQEENIQENEDHLLHLNLEAARGRNNIGDSPNISDKDLENLTSSVPSVTLKPHEEGFNSIKSDNLNPLECETSEKADADSRQNTKSNDLHAELGATGDTLETENANQTGVTDHSDEESKCNRENEESSSESEDEYESAEEGEEIQVDAQNLRELEETLTDEQKEERRDEATELKQAGNEMFRNGSYKSAIKTYSRGLRICPLKFAKDRAIMYSNRAACKMRLEENEACIRDCTKALELHPHYLKALMRRAELYEKTEKLDEALADFQKIVEMDPTQNSARMACMRLPDQIKERNEKMKEEMMGKLKDLGNMVLKPFGLSTNNFKLNQDPNTGGYSVNFVQSPDQNQ